MAESGDAYRRFIRVAKTVGQARLRNSRRHSGERRRQLEQLLNDLIGKLESDRAVTAIEEAWGDLDRDVADLLRRELSLISDMHERDESGEGSEDLSTGKESIEDILGDWLPDWLRHLLKMLNKVLKLVK